jgi:ribonuclease HII
MVIVGIDEAGRGPLAGPVAVGAVALLQLAGLDLTGLKDSKQLSPAARAAWFLKMRDWRAAGQLNYATALVGAKLIDERGISWAIRSGLARCLQKLEIGFDSRILLDGGLRAPKLYLNQTTIIRGDESEPAIALASIAAKIRRDRHLVRLAQRYPDYGFEIHKGYGTARHYAALAQHGPCPIHRRSFLPFDF